MNLTLQQVSVWLWNLIWPVSVAIGTSLKDDTPETWKSGYVLLRHNARVSFQAQRGSDKLWSGNVSVHAIPVQPQFILEDIARGFRVIYMPAISNWETSP